MEKAELLGKSFEVVVDCGKPLAQMEAEACYSWIYPCGSLSQPFTISGEGVSKVKLRLHPGKGQTMRDIMELTLSNEVQMATIEQMHAFAREYPNIQREFNIFAFGSWAETVNCHPEDPELDFIDTVIPFLDGSSKERHYNHYVLDYDDKWEDDFLLLIVDCE